MASSINASLTAGLVSTADTSGIINLQSGGTTVATISSTGAAVTGTLSSTGNTTLGDASTDTLNVGNGGIVKDASGNVGIGTASPAVKLDIYGTGGALSAINPPLQVWDTTALAANIGGGIAFGGNYTGTTKTNWAGIAGLKYNATDNDYSGYLTFYTRPNGSGSTERMHIDPSGNLLVGKTTTANTTRGIYIDSVGKLVTAQPTGAGAFDFYNTSGTQVGYILINASTTTYATSSDYRLKDNVLPMGGALDKIAQLKPVTYTWKIDGSNGQGFIAHELQSIMPDCVIGEKDAVDVDGNPKYQGIDTSFLVATLTAAIQEQQALITSLTARLEVLEAK